jgi:hypothetical protein
MARWPHALAALAFLALAVFAVAYSLQLRMVAHGGPGAGLFPFFIGCGLGAVALLWLAQIATRRPEPVEDAPDGWAVLRVALQLAALALFALLLNPLGYVPAAFLMAVATALIAGARSWPWILVVALLASVGLRLGLAVLGAQL